MTFISKLNSILTDPKKSVYYRKTNNEGGPSAPLNIQDARDWEISWEKGRAVLLNTPRVKKPHGELMPETPKDRGDITWDRGGSNTGTLPTDPNAPLDKLMFKNRDRNLTEGTRLTMSYVARLASVLAAPLSFNDVLKIIKTLYPDLKMKFPKPPTFVWNPKKEGAEVDEGVDDSIKLNPQEIKDKLKVKLPQLKWTLRMSDGVEEAELGFTDDSTALFEIGAKANHLTLTFYETKTPQTLTYDDSEA